MRIVILISTIAFLCVPSLDAALADSDVQTATLIVHVEGLKPEDGSLRFVLFDSKKTFLKNPLRAEAIDLQSWQGQWRVDELPFGTGAA